MEVNARYMLTQHRGAGNGMLLRGAGGGFGGYAWWWWWRRWRRRAWAGQDRRGRMEDRHYLLRYGSTPAQKCRGSTSRTFASGVMAGWKARFTHSR